MADFGNVMGEVLSRGVQQPDLAGSMNQGVEQGVQVAHAQAQLTQMRALIDSKHQELQDKRNHFFMDYMDKGFALKNQNMRKAYFGSLPGIYQQVFQENMNPDVADYFTKFFAQDPTAENSDNTQWVNNWVKNPQLRPQIAQAVVDAGMANDVPAAVDMLNKSSKIEQDQIRSALIGGRVDYAHKLSFIQQNKQFLNPTTANQVLQSPNMGIPSSAVTEATQGANQQLQQRMTNMQDRLALYGKYINSKVLTNQDFVNLGQQKVDIARQQLELSGKRLNLQQINTMSQIEGKISTTTPGIKESTNSIMYLDNALNTIQNPPPGGFKWIDLSDVTADYTRALTGKGNFAQGSEQAKTFSSVMSTLDKWKGKIENHEDGGPSPAELQQFQTRVEHLRDSFAQSHDQLYQTAIKKKVAVGALPQDVAGALYSAGRMKTNPFGNDPNPFAQPVGRGGGGAAPRKAAPAPAAPGAQGDPNRVIQVPLKGGQAKSMAVGALRAQLKQSPDQNRAAVTFKALTGEDL